MRTCVDGKQRWMSVYRCVTSWENVDSFISASDSEEMSPRTKIVSTLCCEVKLKWRHRSACQVIWVDRSMLHWTWLKPSLASLSAIALPMPEAAPVTITTRRGTLMEKVAGTGSHRFGTSCTRLSPSYYGIMYNEQPIWYIYLLPILTTHSPSPSHWKTQLGS